VTTPSLPIIGSVIAPRRAEIITHWMIEEFHTSSPGGRFYTMMLRAAIRHRRNDWMLTADELANAALAISPTEQSGSKRKNAVGEALHALGWAAKNIQPLTQAQRVAAKIKHSRNFRKVRSA